MPSSRLPEKRKRTAWDSVPLTRWPRLLNVYERADLNITTADPFRLARVEPLAGQRVATCVAQADGVHHVR